MKVYIERNNLQLELIRYSKNVDFIQVYFCKATESPTERIAGSFKHKPLWLHFWQLRAWVNALLYIIKYVYSRTPLIRPPSESHWCGRIRGMVAREGFVYEQKPLSVTRNVVIWEGWSLVRVVVRQGFYCNTYVIYVIYVIYWYI